MRRLGVKGLYRVILVANVVGLATIGALNLLTPLDYFRVMRVFISRRGGWEDFVLFWAAAALAGFLIQTVVLTPLRELKKALAADDGTVSRGPFSAMLRSSTSP